MRHNVIILPYHPDKIKPYLPDNYLPIPAGFLPDDWQTYLNPDDWTVAHNPRLPDESTVVIGTDVAGWTMHDYVLPRLASGMYYPAYVGNDQPVLTKQLLLRICGEGFDDESGGDVEAPTGHYMRVARYMLHTNSQGSVDLVTYQSEQDAREQFASLEDEYTNWSAQDEEDGE